MHDGLPKVGDVLLGKYLLESVLGEGGMGVVFAARHELLGQRVAVKVVQPIFARHPEAVARFVNEARASARIDSDHVARVLDVGTIDGNTPYMVLEYLEGEDLEHVATKRWPLPVEEVVDYVLEAIEGVAYAHALGIVHRDLKPSNLFLAKRQDGTARVKVLDFGISKMGGDEQASMTRTNSPLGSPLYMSPEQLRNAKGVSVRSDIWAFGVILFQLLTGRTPFLGETAVELFVAIRESQPPSMQSLRPGVVPPQLEVVVLRCLRQNPEERFASVAELALALAPFGTEVSKRSVENSARVLGKTAAARPPASSEPSLPVAAAAKSAADASAGANSQTSGSWAGSSQGQRAKRSVAVIVAAVIAALVCVGVAAAALHGRAVARSSASVDLSAPRSALAASSASSAASVATPVPASASTASSMPTSSGSVSSPTASASATSPSTAKPKSNNAPHKPKSSCDPPYDFDASGKKHWKTECL